nr:patatin-like phospholipase family protein [Melittangium boletus]
MDGSPVAGGEGYITAGILQSLRRMLDDAGDTRALLNQVDLFVGSSAGAFNAAFFAREEDPDAALSRSIDFWSEVVAMNKKGVSPGRLMRTLAGSSSLVDSRYMRDFFCGYFGATTTLGDLKKKLVIPAFQLDGQRRGLRIWRPKVFHNVGGPDEPDLNELLVDVLMRSGSPPLVYPIYQGLRGQGSGYVDGGVYANNPSLVGLASALREMGREESMESEPPDLSNILLLSLGNGRMSKFLTADFREGTANWGFARWLLEVRDPLLLIKMLLDAGSDAIDYQCRMILRKGYFRMNPVVEKALHAYERKHVEAGLQQELTRASCVDRLAQAHQWLVGSGWLSATPRT